MKDYCYELCVIFSPEIESDRERHYKRLRDLLDSEGVELIAEKDWGLRKFAYPIKKHTSGFYSFFYFKAAKETPRKISEDFKMQEDVLRHLLIKRVIGKDINLDDLTREEMVKVESDFETEDDFDARTEERPSEDEAPKDEAPKAETGEAKEEVIEENEPSYNAKESTEESSTENEEPEIPEVEDEENPKDEKVDEEEIISEEDLNEEDSNEDVSDEKIEDEDESDEDKPKEETDEDKE